MTQTVFPGTDNAFILVGTDTRGTRKNTAAHLITEGRDILLAA